MVTYTNASIPALRRRLAIRRIIGAVGVAASLQAQAAVADAAEASRVRAYATMRELSAIVAAAAARDAAARRLDAALCLAGGLGGHHAESSA